MCLIESCDRKPIAMGLCAKHYMRQRRTGEANTIGKPGRKRSPERLSFEASGMRMSPRTFARFKEAMGMLQVAGCDINPCIEAALRPNGNLNVSKFVRIAAERYFELLTELYGLDKP